MAVRSKYQPFSFQERITPLMMLQEQYDNMNEKLYALGQQATEYYQYLDPATKEVVGQYNAQLDNIANSLASEGMKAVSRNTLNQLRSTYNNDVKPINDAAKTLAGMYAKRRELEGKLNASGQQLLAGEMPTVSDLLKNPDASPHLVSSGALYNQGMNASKSASARNFYESEFGKEIIRGYIKTVQRQGYSPQLVQQFIQDVSAIPELAADIDRIKEMYNTQGLKDPVAADRFIMQGILDGIQYSEKSDYKTDIIGKEARDYARDIAKIRLSASLNNKSTTSGKSGSKAKTENINTKAFITKRDHDTAYKNFIDSKTGSVKGIDQFFGKDGKLQKPEAVYTTGSMGNYGAGNYQYQINAPLTRSYDNLMEMLGRYYTSDQIAGMNKAQVEQAIRSIASGESYDMQAASQYYWNLDAEATKYLINTINNGSEVVKVKDRDSQGNFVYGKSGKLDKPGTDETVEVRYDPNSNVLLMRRNGDYYKVPMDILPQELMNSLQSFTAPQSDKEGNALPSTLNQIRIDVEDMESAFAQMNINPEEALATLQEQVALGRTLSPEQQQLAQYLMLYQARVSELEEADSIFGNVGNVLTSYTGKRNLNK